VIIDPGTAPDASWDAELRMVRGGTIDTTVDLLYNLGDNISATATQFIFPLTASGGIVQLFGDALIRIVDDFALAELVEGPFAKVTPHKLIGEPFSPAQGEGVLEKVVIAINRNGRSQNIAVTPDGTPKAFAILVGQRGNEFT
jgi:hypothetical protein